MGRLTILWQSRVKNVGVYEGIPERGYCGSIVLGLEV